MLTNAFEKWQNIQRVSIPRPIAQGKPIDLSVVDLFQAYQKQILENAKKSEMDYIKETFANTELFDTTNTGNRCQVTFKPSLRGNVLVAPVLEDITLPFASCFVKVFADSEEVNSVFIKEFTPDILTGATYLNLNGFGRNMRLITPFSINLLDMELSVDLKDIKNSNTVVFRGFNADDELLDMMVFEHFNDMAVLIWLATHALNSLNEHAVVVDHLKKSEYYTFKDKSKRTIKVENRPIYYVMDKHVYENKSYNINPVTKLEYSFSFKVRGHWRHLKNSNTCGKDRNGVRREELKGRTWVKDFIKGEGDLVQRVRIVK